MTFRLGLTGSIGMGKSTTAQMFRDLGVPVWDADATVHDLYAKDGAAVAPIESICPEAVVDGRVDRDALKAAIKTDPHLLDRIEAVVHPLVAESRKAFLAKHTGAELVVLDIPLLFETNAEGQVDAIAVVSTDPATQKQRVLARPGMSADMFDTIMARQVADPEKRKRADYIIRTDALDQTREIVADLVADLTT